jgi:hypothetical protein
MADNSTKEKISMDDPKRKRLVEPIHVATINGHRLRFFGSPEGNTAPDRFFHETYNETPDREPELPDLPWVSLDDLLSGMDVPADQRPPVWRSYAPPSRTVTIKDSEVYNAYPTPWKVPCTQTVATTGGTVVIAPESIASEIMRGPKHNRRYERHYEIAKRAALDKITDGLSVQKLFVWLGGAHQRGIRDYLALLMMHREQREPRRAGA